MIGGGANRVPERRSTALCGVGRRFEQHLVRHLLEQLRVLRLVQHREARGDIGLEWEVVKDVGAEGVDGLHFQPARCLQRQGEQLAARAHACRGFGVSTFLSRMRFVSSASSSAVHFAIRQTRDSPCWLQPPG